MSSENLPTHPVVIGEQLPMRQEPTAGDLLSLMIEKSGGALAMETAQAFQALVQLKREEEDRHAAREFAAAMAAFQNECPSIPKTSTAQIATKSGSRFSYTYAELAEIARTVNPYLHSRGLSYSWDSETSDNSVEAIITLRHENGHSITARFKAPIDSSMAASKAQQAASALTYAKRQALVQVLGLTTCDPDADGAETPDIETITEEQIATLQALLDEVGVNSSRLLKYVGVANLSDIPVARFAEAVRLLEKQRVKK